MDYDHFLEELSALCGIESEFWDVFGEKHVAGPDTKKRILAAMGFEVETAADLANGIARVQNVFSGRVLAPVVVLREDRAPYRLTVNFPKGTPDELLEWEFATEEGREFSGKVYRSQLEWQGDERHRTESGGEIVIDHYAFPLPAGVPLGYHRLLIKTGEAVPHTEHSCQVVVTPARCYEPEALQNGGRIWGLAAQLYGLRSKRNWGIGDFTDLQNLLAAAHRLGAAVVGISPLHAVSLQNLIGASPYSPTDRVGTNVLFLDVEAVPEFAHSEKAQRLVNTPEFRARLDELRNKELVDYLGVWDLKREVLELLYEDFVSQHVKPKTERGAAFDDFVKKQGDALRLYCVYQVMEEHFKAQDPMLWGWPAWPEDYRTPHTTLAKDFETKHLDRVEFYQYLEWVAQAQLRAADDYAQSVGMPVGIYADVALGPNGGGAETWAARDAFSFGMSLGAPPDDYSLAGQSWGITPFNPLTLREQAYRPFIETLRANMLFAGAVRVDHVMCLARLFWVPQHLKPADGGYVRYPTDDLIGIIALESVRNRCLVIGEDLGTVPNDLRVAMNERFLLSYRVLLFMKNQFGEFCRAEEYQRNALVTASTHDLPTLVGFWSGHDIALREQLALYPSPDFAERQKLSRKADKERLIILLEEAGLLPARPAEQQGPEQMTPELAQAIQVYLARTPSCLLLLQLEDLLAINEQANLPGTVTEHPNWRRKLTRDIDEIEADENLIECLRAVQQSRAEMPAGHTPGTPAA